MTIENDIVLIHFEDQPTTYARVESIAPDVKKDWFIIDLLILEIPLQNISWILKDIYINGEEFTMNGTRIRLEKIKGPEKKLDDEPEPDTRNDDKSDTNVISFASRKK